MEVASIQVLP